MTEMNFKAEDELENFCFQDAKIQKIEQQEDCMTFILDAVIIKAKNSQNANFTDSYAGTLSMRLIDANIQKAVREGYKYYNANDELVEEVADTPLSEKEISTLLKMSEGYYLFDVVKVDDAQNETGHFLYLFGIDADEETSYWLQIEFEKSIVEWDRYMNRVQNG